MTTNIMTITVRLESIEITYEQATDPTEFPLIYSSNTVIETTRENGGAGD